MHQQHIRDAVERPGLKDRNVFAPVLETFVWALPHTFREFQEEEGARVHLLITGDAGGQWSLRREQRTWTLGKIGTELPDAQVVLDQETAWRLFTKGTGKAEALQHAILAGNERLAMKVLDTVSIIA